VSASPITELFKHFPDGPNQTIHTGQVQPIFDSLSPEDQAWVTDTVRKFDPQSPDSYPALADVLGVQQSVAYGLMTLLHPNA
jgi:hypothetical protein